MKKKLNFNYDELEKENYKLLVSEILNFLKNNKKIDIDEIIFKFQQKFKVVEVPVKPLEKSLFYQFTKDIPLGQNIQGHLETTENGKPIRLPIIVFSADLNTLDDMINTIIKKYNELNVKK